MSITKCPGCRRLCFSDALSCPTCSLVFQAGELTAKAAAEEKAFDRKWNLIFMAALILFLVALGLAGLRPTA